MSHKHILFYFMFGITSDWFLQKFHFDDEEEEEEGENSEEIEVFPATHCNRYMMRLVDFKLKTQVNFAEEGLGQKSANVRIMNYDLTNACMLIKRCLYIKTFFHDVFLYCVYKAVEFFIA